MKPLFLLIAAAACSAVPSPETFSLLRRHAGFTADEIEAVRRGERVVRALRTARQEEVGFAGATRLPITVSAYLGRLRAGTLYRPGENVLRIGRFSEKPSVSDMRDLRFESYDLPPGSSADSHRRALLETIGEFERSGTMSVGPLGGPMDRVDAPSRFEPMVREAAYLRERLPAAWEYLLRYPQAPSRGRDDFYLWTQLTFGFRPLTRVAQVSIWEDRGEAIVMTRQIYSNRYFEASFQVDHLVPDESGLWLVTLNYGRSEMLQGITGRMIRPIVVSRTLALAAKTLDQARKDLQSND